MDEDTEELDLILNDDDAPVEIMVPLLLNDRSGLYCRVCRAANPKYTFTLERDGHESTSGLCEDCATPYMAEPVWT